MQYSLFEVNPFRWEGGKRFVYRKICNLETDTCYVSGGEPEWTKGMITDWQLRADEAYVFIQSNNTGETLGAMQFYLVETATGRELQCVNCSRSGAPDLAENKSVRWEGDFLRFDIHQRSLRKTQYWLATVDDGGYHPEMITELADLDSPAYRTGAELSENGRYLGWAECGGICERVIFDREGKSTSRSLTSCKDIYWIFWWEGEFSADCGS